MKEIAKEQCENTGQKKLYTMKFDKYTLITGVHITGLSEINTNEPDAVHFLRKLTTKA